MAEVYAIAAWAGINTLSTADKAWLETQITQTSLTTARRSITAPDEVLLKWRDKANPLTAKSVTNIEYTHTQIKTEIAGTHWNAT